MKFRELNTTEHIDKYLGQVIEFLPGILRTENFPCPGMHGRVLSVVTKNDIVRVHVDIEEFDARNVLFEETNYFGKASRGQNPKDASYTAKQVGMYEPITWCYFMEEENVEDFFKLAEEVKNEVLMHRVYSHSDFLSQGVRDVQEMIDMACIADVPESRAYEITIKVVK